MLIVLLLLVVVVFFFIKEYFPPDTVVLLAIIALVVLVILTPQEAFSGFGTSLIVVLVSIFIISGAIKYNGVVEYLASKLSLIRTSNYSIIISIIMLPVGFLSAFMNNTSVVAITSMSIKSLAEKLKISPSKVLMPTAFASLLGGTCTLIGTSTNIAGNNFLISKGLNPIEMFEFLPIGLSLLFFTTLFFILFGNKIFREESVGDLDTSKNHRLFYSDFEIVESSKLHRKGAKALRQSGVEFIKVVKQNGLETTDEDYLFQNGDRVYIQATNENLKNFYNLFSLDNFHQHNRISETEIIEIMVLPASSSIGFTLKESNFNESTGLTVVGIFRKNSKYERSLENIHLRVGDILIAEGRPEEIERIRLNNDFVILNQKRRAEFPHLRKGFIVLTIFIASILSSAMGLLPVSISLLIAVLLIVGLNIVPSKEVYSHVDWRLIILIGGMSAFGVAVTKTGIDTFLADFMVSNFSNFPPLLLVFVFMVVTVLLTQPMSNAAAALVVLPIALKTATSFGLDPRGFSIAIILSASISMLTPFEPASLLVFRPGGYRVSDFFKIGGVLTVCCLIIILFMINKLYF